jgi:ketosteroid isomerase-like protein
MSQRNVDMARQSVESWNRDDLDSFLEVFHPEIEFYSEIARRVEGVESPVRGLAELRQFWEEWRAVWDLTIDISEYHDLGEVVMSVGHIRTRGKGSGVDVEGPVAYVNQFEAGLIRKVRAYLDPKQALEAVDLS